MLEMRWSVVVRKGGRALGVLEEESRRWVVPVHDVVVMSSVPKTERFTERRDMIVTNGEVASERGKD